MTFENEKSGSVFAVVPNTSLMLDENSSAASELGPNDNPKTVRLITDVEEIWVNDANL